MRIADTSALYALFNADDEHHPRARDFAASHEPFVIPAEILSETLGLIDLRRGGKAARAAAAYLRQLGQAEFQPTPDDPWDDVQGEAWKLFMESPGKLSHADAIVAAWCRRRNLKPWTYDRDLEKAAIIA